jgi:hypothetical protein
MCNMFYTTPWRQEPTKVILKLPARRQEPTKVILKLPASIGIRNDGITNLPYATRKSGVIARGVYMCRHLIDRHTIGCQRILYSVAWGCETTTMYGRAEAFTSPVKSCV